ncbi:MAG: flagellin hook IN motif-containing protein [Pirellulaceae bacterium]
MKSFRVPNVVALSLQGSGSSTVIDDATFQLSKRVGAVEIDIAVGESLATVADRINASTDATGATAVDGDRLVIEATELGSSGFVQIELLAGEQDITVTGVRNNQLDGASATSMAADTSVTLSGGVLQAAGRRTEAVAPTRQYDLEQRDLYDHRYRGLD